MSKHTSHDRTPSSAKERSSTTYYAIARHRKISWCPAIGIGAVEHQARECRASRLEPHGLLLWRIATEKTTEMHKSNMKYKELTTEKANDLKNWTHVLWNLPFRSSSLLLMKGQYTCVVKHLFVLSSYLVTALIAELVDIFFTAPVLAPQCYPPLKISVPKTLVCFVISFRPMKISLSSQISATLYFIPIIQSYKLLKTTHFSDRTHFTYKAYLLSTLNQIEQEIPTAIEQFV